MTEDQAYLHAGEWGHSQLPVRILWVKRKMGSDRQFLQLIFPEMVAVLTMLSFPLMFFLQA